MNKFIIGLILGIAIAGGLAFYLNNAPSQFINKVTTSPAEMVSASSNPIILAPGTKLREISNSNGGNNQEAASTPTASAPNYDFYDILQGKKAASNSSDASTQPAAKIKYFVQAGAFSNQNLANDMKARLALLGFDALIKAQEDNGKIVNQIIIGPLDSLTQANEVRQQLINNNIKATIIKTIN